MIHSSVPSTLLKHSAVSAAPSGSSPRQIHSGCALRLSHRALPAHTKLSRCTGQRVNVTVCKADEERRPSAAGGDVEPSLGRRTLMSSSVLAGSSMLATLGMQDMNAWAAGYVYSEEGFSTAASGLKWMDVSEGTGSTPIKGQLIRAHYTGRLADNGRQFDSSYERGRPLSFKVGVREVIAGWDEGIIGGDGIPGMKEGGKRKLIIPAELGYGARGAGGGIIPPNAALLFDVELLPPRKN
mmetsp:Transcript_20670/g.24842  ORF Transcript_20670/g.24842 Transcript_20670/m.24842 type:complete len:240 (+) Transcript_20670:52-771(+)|eukprot:CAMPEP_0197849204 /NCGR_PEP_ID=MMETSP1438-20131217/11247_1 /TAXON_ID=1461541 /ORGANISM="Pterosperma sp., Strain CCMP1384" /LENGTH=239 /DNA_ID=CAMNT_0043461777 /DNA_START=46 /DNA_END=765 /DNA_ORIENTATION=+